ncbi:b9 domain-containing protein 1 [Plasmopara halstedii]|uniref:B9 domain-containing protein 1 n=1 Tax=Plasmopara halstedii TaxID=4781 RepID=A0A0P1A9G7_PLAHL|nr:b9 domain-containing protein 1 [Plasmopara halstedii]CEG37004.1 b9 domain-containing protein 1 [Plasmopara halstedii]|eukprot:XP_024573373.1 b9 domain-containing protein 1 [Plasmopara halstedii]
MATNDAVAKALERLRLKKERILNNNDDEMPETKTSTPLSMQVAQPASGFQLICSGEVESVHYPGVTNVYCRYSITHGVDWRVLHGAENGLSQIAYLGRNEDEILLNFPIDVSFKSTNPFGWPRLVLSLYGLDGLGRDVVRGYGSIAFPVTPGCSRLEVPLFRPISSSRIQQFVAWFTGSPPEYFDSKFIAQSDSREVTRVTSAGKVRVLLNVATYGMKQYGYT